MTRTSLFLEDEVLAWFRQQSKDSKRLYGAHLTVSEIIREAAHRYMLSCSIKKPRSKK